MKVLFSLDYKSGIAYLGMANNPVMMDTQVVDLNGLLNFFELRLGLHTPTLSDSERLVEYYKCVRSYMNFHKEDKENQLYGSYTVSPLATSREMLKWRDALRICGWSQDTPCPSRRLKVLSEVEKLFSEKDIPDLRSRIDAIKARMNQKEDLMSDVTFVFPFDVENLHPELKELFHLSKQKGADMEMLQTPDIEGNDNLSQLKRLLTSEKAEKIALNPNDPSLRLWKFKDEMECDEYLALLWDYTFDVTVDPSSKLIDNYLHMMGKPVSGSMVANSSPQIIQLFFTGVALFARPLNISALLQWLYAPIHPLPSNFRYRLAERLARTGGWYPDMEDDRSSDCYKLVNEWVEGKTEKDKSHPIDEKESESRRQKVAIFLPSFYMNDETSITVSKLHTFLTELSLWSRQRSAMISQEDASDHRIAQLNKLSELCETLKNLTDDQSPDAQLPYSEIEKHIACLYEPTEFVQYTSQAKSRFTVSLPGQVCAPADSVLWSGLHDYKVNVAATSFLTPTEESVLSAHLRLWHKDDLRKIEFQTQYLPILFCQRQLTLATVDIVDGKPAIKHPLIVRIEQQVKNYKDLFIHPEIEEYKYDDVSPLTNNATEDSDGLYTYIKRSDLIRWRTMESPTSIEKLVQNPLDYTLEHIAHISDNGQSDLCKLPMTKGNVAHAVIQHLFYIPDDPSSGYASAIKQRVESSYEKVFDQVVLSKGAMLLLQENSIERRQLFSQLRECINRLIDIIEKNSLHVVNCELPLTGDTLGYPNENTPRMTGYADMVLCDESGRHIVFDFKWTSSKDYYQSLLRENRSSQLAIYSELLSELTNDNPLPTAYFLMPQGRLFSTYHFKSYWAEQLPIDSGCEGNIINKLVASYRYRRKEIMSGKIENGEGCPLELLDYFNSTDAENLFPLKPEYKSDSIKAINEYSNYTILKK